MDIIEAPGHGVVPAAEEWSEEQVKDLESQEWIDSLDYVLDNGGPARVHELLEELSSHAHQKGIEMPFSANTPYLNTIPASKQPPYPGSREIERRIKSLIRWNAMAMVVRANQNDLGLGGHISTFASAATLYEVAFNHFLRGKDYHRSGDMVYIQGHASPGIYARAFLEGRMGTEQLEKFRQELIGGPSSYPHPWLMPNFWEFPTVSMGLGPITAIYQARYNKYLENRGLKPKDDCKVWAFLGDGETDEPESLGALTLASREKLDNLIFVINCNLQRLDGPVRGNGKIIQELEAAFRGAGWNVIKVIWGEAWDDMMRSDESGEMVKRAGEVVDGEYQKYIVESGAYVREHFFGASPQLADMVKHLSDEQLQRMRRGGHDPEKVFSAFHAAVRHKGQPTVILAKTIKGYGMGEAGEGRNITHQQKKLNVEELKQFRTRFGIPISDDDIMHAPFYRPPEDSAEMRYLRERRKQLGGSLPHRIEVCPKLPQPQGSVFEEFQNGSNGRELSSTMAFVRILTKLLKDPGTGKYVVPIVPDEARTFGMESLFRQCGIYSSVGQVYDPVDSDSLLYYKESQDGQILEEGITEAGSMSSFIAAGTAYATHGIPTCPFFIFYSMFGFQRIGDLIWLAADARCKGFLLGATAGRTTLNGEGLQHQDGHSHLIAYTVPNLMCYDPAYAYELAVIVKDGMKRMYEDKESIFYYLTVYNENYAQPPMPQGAEEGILKGMYRLRTSELNKEKPDVQLLGSGPLLNESVKAQDILEHKYGVSAEVWSVTSYKELRRDGKEVDRHNLLQADQPARTPWVTQCLGNGLGARGVPGGGAQPPLEPGVVVATSDYLKLMPDSLARWIPKPLVSLGTDGFGRSDTRKRLREFFEVDHRFVVLGALGELVRQGKVKASVYTQAVKDLEVDVNKLNPMIS